MEKLNFRNPRKETLQLKIGDIKIGGSSPVVVQTMTNTLTSDVRSTLLQINSVVKYGADLVRVSCPDESSTNSLREIIKESPVPIIADIHFHYKRALEAINSGAACIRINPGNIGSKERVLEIIKAAKDFGCAIRIGVNAGSLEKSLLEKYLSPCPEALVESAMNHVKFFEDHDFRNIKLSVKSSDIFLSYESYKLLSQKTKYPLHIGITEAGGNIAGTIKSSIGLGRLLWEGIGDTIRVSLSADPIEEVKVGYEILKSLKIRHRGVSIISCPSCARQAFPVIKTVKALEEKLSHITAPITLSVIGCVVNGPGEAKNSDIGITGGGNNTNMLYLSGVADHKIDNSKIVDNVVELVEKKAKFIESQNKLKPYSS